MIKTRLAGAGVMLVSAPRSLAASPALAPADANAVRFAPPPARGVEGQRIADLGDGTFLNPIVSGDHPDPTVLKDGADYDLAFSSFNSFPGIVIWHSRDLVKWRPIGPALLTNLGTIWAIDLCKEGNRYSIYLPVLPPSKPWSIYVIWADDIAGSNRSKD